VAAHHQRFPVKVDDHALAHGIKGAIGAAHAHRSRHHQVAEGVGLVGDAPGMTNWGGVAGGANHDFCPLISAFPRHFGEHAVVADDQRQGAAVRPFADGNADVAGFPRLDGDPGMQLAVVELEFPFVVNNQAAVVGVALGVEFHDGKAAPDVVIDAGLAKGGDLWPIEPTHDVGVGIHREAVQRVFGEDDQIHGGQVAAGFGDHVNDALGLGGEIFRRHHIRQLGLHHP
jgi:hypothetical protein